jgi:MFS family permease
MPETIEAKPMTRTMWLICVLAAIGFAFDIYELLMLPLIVQPALAELGGRTAEGALVYAPGSEGYLSWARTLFFVPALVGGVFGLLGGYLTDLLGRRRVLTWSILMYAFGACASGFVTSIEQLLVLRCVVFAGVCVEFVAAVAWLAELFDNPKQRERALGYTQAFSSVGGLLVSAAFYFISKIASELPAIQGGHEAWRYTLISGVIPALPLILIRPFLPESPRWQARRASGTLKRPSFAELFGPGLAKTTIVTTLMFAASYGIAFGAIQQLPQVLKGQVQIKADGLVAEQAAKEQKLPPPRVAAAKNKAQNETIATVQTWQEVGGLCGRFLLAFLAVQIVSRRALLRIFQFPALLFVPLFFWWISENLETAGSLAWIKWGIFLTGLVTVSQFSFWGNYIPRVFPLHLRGTGESFAANIGGRVLGTAAAWLTLTLSPANEPNKIALVGGIVAGCYCLVGFILSFVMKEPSQQLDDE